MVVSAEQLCKYSTLTFQTLGSGMLFHAMLKSLSIGFGIGILYCLRCRVSGISDVSCLLIDQNECLLVGSVGVWASTWSPVESDVLWAAYGFRV